MKLTDIWKSRQKPTISFELFPPRTEKTAENLEKTIDVLADLKPDFVSVTFGAGGSNRDGSLQLARKLKHDKKLEVITYFAGYGLGPDDITSVLNNYREIGIENILAVRGDKPEDENFKPHTESFSHANELVKFIKPKYDFCLGVAGYPEKHIEAASKEKDMEYLKLKVDEGAEFIMANYFYDNNFFFDFVERCRKNGINLPILPGIMPVYSIKMMEMLASICGATITENLRKGIAALPEGDKEALTSFGIEFAAAQCSALLKTNVPGLHFYTMDRSESVAGILSKLKSENFL
ncbi:MAG: methylenetetrahydrofolate reductase [Bacteroidales bacterium]|nr:methylenetetrahydrofolate reductase [Bacteroidales bacterium]